MPFYLSCQLQLTQPLALPKAPEQISKRRPFRCLHLIYSPQIKKISVPCTTLLCKPGLTIELMHRDNDKNINDTSLKNGEPEGHERGESAPEAMMTRSYIAVLGALCVRRRDA